jgi:hypothetical protein
MALGGLFDEVVVRRGISRIPPPGAGAKMPLHLAAAGRGTGLARPTAAGPRPWLWIKELRSNNLERWASPVARTALKRGISCRLPEKDWGRGCRDSMDSDRVRLNALEGLSGSGGRRLSPLGSRNRLGL